ncbi:hypothetical protein Hanom_Chr17g01533241 [Helianthus anomalus]
MTAAMCISAHQVLVSALSLSLLPPPEVFPFVLSLSLSLPTVIRRACSLYHVVGKGVLGHMTCSLVSNHRSWWRTVVMVLDVYIIQFCWLAVVMGSVTWL